MVRGPRRSGTHKLLVTAGALGGEKYSPKCLHCSSPSSAAHLPSGRESLMRVNTVGEAEESLWFAPGWVSRKAAVQINSRLQPFHFFTLLAAC